jgi:hypothetical protein
VTAEIILTTIDARALTDQIKTGVEAVWHLISRAYTERAWSALGYASWDDYCTREFGTSRLRLPREERAEVVSSLRESGLSIRAIASATGTGTRQVQEDLRDQVCSQTTPDVESELMPKSDIDPMDVLTPEQTAAFDKLVSDVEAEFRAEQHSVAAPKPVTGRDGKSYPAKPSAPTTAPRRRPLTDQAETAGWELHRAVERIEKLLADDRFADQKTKVAPHLRGHLTNAINTCQGVLDRINQEEE